MVEWEVEIETEICGSAADWPFHYKDGSEHTVTSYSCQFFTMVEVNIMEHHILANFREREKNWSSYEVKDHVWVNVVELMALYTDENPWFTCTKFNSKSNWIKIYLVNVTWNQAGNFEVNLCRYKPYYGTGQRSRE